MISDLWKQFLKEDGRDVDEIRYIRFMPDHLIEVTRGWDKYFVIGSHCPFTVHHAFMDGVTWYIFVSGRSYHKNKWILRIANVLGTHPECICIHDDKEVYDAYLENTRKSYGTLEGVSSDNPPF